MSKVIGIKMLEDCGAAVCELANGVITDVDTYDYRDAIDEVAKIVDDNADGNTTIITEIPNVPNNIETIKQLRELENEITRLKQQNHKLSGRVHLIGLTSNQWRSAYNLPTALRSDVDASIDQVINTLSNFSLEHLKKHWFDFTFESFDDVDKLFRAEADAVLLAFTQYNTVLTDYTFIKDINAEDLITKSDYTVIGR